MMYHQPQRTQMPHAPFYHTMPPQVYYGDDPSMFHGSHAYTYPPVQCHGHGCCNHNFFPSNFPMRPPYPPYHNHASPVPPSYPFCYPPAQGMYPPVTYYPPPNYTTELPRYEFDKDMSKGAGHHCWGWCPNHPSQGGNLKIVEEEPEVEKKSDSSLVPFEAKNYSYPYPYPVAWLQPNNIMNADENKKPDKNFGTHTSENQQQQPIIWNGWFPYDTSRVQSSNQEEKKSCNQEHEEGAESQQPTVWKGWFPLELSNNLGSMKQDKERGGNQQQKDEDKQRNLPFPIFWMPYKPSVTEGEEKPEIATKKDMSKEKSSGEGKAPLLITNVPTDKSTDNKEKPERNVLSEEGPNVSKTNRVVKTIPVKQLEEEVEEDKRTSSKIEEEIKKKPLEESTKKQSSSALKTSKLPPVCLRVEPLRKKKGSNGNSRSPSPPGDKRKTYDVSGTESRNLKTKEGRENQPEITGDRSKVEEKRSKTTEEATAAANGSYKQGEVNSGSKTGDNVSHDNTTRKENSERSNACKEDQVVHCDVGQKGCEDLEAKITAAEEHSLIAKDSSEEEAEESRKVKFSDAEAATMIQAAYRGFEVRKSEPLKKLKKIAEVKEEVAGIRHRIQALESSCNVKDYEKEKIMITEMIMNLLLNLDAIQGLHKSIRDVRKSIAKELVSLQETLDALVIVEKSSPSPQEQPSGKSSPSPQEQPSGMSSEETLLDVRNEDTNIELQNEDVVIEHHDLFKIDNKVSPPEEQWEKQQVLGTDSLPKSEDVENSVAMVTGECLVDELKDVSGGYSAEFLHGASDSTSIVGDNKKEHGDVQSLPMTDSSCDDKEMANSEDVFEERGIEISNILPLGVHDQDPNAKDTINDDHMSEEVAGYAVKEATKADEMIISSQEKEVLEERHEGSQEGKKEEKINDGIFPERPQEVGGMSELPLGDVQIEVPKEVENGAETCEADETTHVDIPKESEQGLETCKADEPDREQPLEKYPIKVSSISNNDMQFEQDELQKDQLERDTGSVSSFLHDDMIDIQDVQVELQKDHGLETDSELGKSNVDKTGLVTISKEAIGGLREDHVQLPNSSVEEDLEIVPPLGVENSDEVNVAADEMENIGPVVIPDGKMGEMYLSTDGSEGVKHVLAGASNQADELDLTAPSETGSQASLESETVRENDRKLMEENEKLRDMMEKLLEAGNKQLNTISELSLRVNDLEKRLAKKKKQLKIKRRPKALHPQEIPV
ncbi:hypothetical protein Leryth_001381 [Lithospermum erythrorhizon]|nr:hypothetical protein Leryth_001381 [Lithospermum erythrorhizon]